MADKRTDSEFMDELEAAARMKPHVTSNLLLFSITALVIFFVVWAAISQVEEITRGSGQVIPSQEIQVVQSLEGGILQELLVSEGERVSRGQILMRISDVQFASEERGTEARSRGLRAQRARLQAEAAGTNLLIPPDIAAAAPDIAATEEALYRSRQEELANAKAILDDRIARVHANIEETRAQITRLTNNRSLLNQELAITSEMVRQRAVARVEELRLQREVSDISGQISANQEKLRGLEAELRSTRRERQDVEDKFRSQALALLNEVETQIAQLEESLRSIGDRVSRAELRSPLDGVINSIGIKTIGGVIEPAQRLVEIVPVDDELKILARVSPQDIAFLRVEQLARVKISAYDPQRYGALEGHVTRIGANSVTDGDGNIFFEIEVRTEKNYLGLVDHPLPITPGMVAETEIITGRRTIMEYLLKPILRARDRALTEP